MTELRRSERRSPTDIVQVTDVVMNETIGQLGNVSPEGLMLITTEPIAEGSIFQLSFRLPGLEGAATDFSLGATSLWSMEASSGSYWSGFQIVDMSDEQDEELRNLYSVM